MRVGVTGARGVLGTRIVATLLQRDHDVYAFPGDVRDADAVARWMAGIDCVVHCAAVVPVQQVAEQAGSAIAVNVGGTANVASAAGRLGRRLVYISTSHVYRPSNAGLAETDALAPMSLYGLTKRQGEEWVERLAPGSLVLRLFSYFDERQARSFLVPGLLARIGGAAPGATLDLFGGRNRRDIASATWLAEVCTTLSETGVSGIVNCATGSNLSVSEIAERLARAMGREDITWNIIQDRPTDVLVSDTGRLRSLLPAWPEFDLDGALANYARDAVPRDDGRT